MICIFHTDIVYFRNFTLSQARNSELIRYAIEQSTYQYDLRNI